ncbi:PAS domain S-box protein [Bradyrhizobium sp. UFLA05-153]
MSVLAPDPSLRSFARPLAIAVFLVLLAATGYFGIRNWRERQATFQVLAHSGLVLDTLDRLRTTTADLETERRGYLQTLDPAYLKAYGVSDARVRRDVQALQALVTNDPLQSLRAEHLALTVSAMLRETDDMVKTARTSGLAALAMIRNMDEIRSQIDQIVDNERFLLVDQEARAGSLEQRKTWLIAAAIVIATALAAAALVFARLEARQRRRTTDENVRLHKDLEERNRKIRRLFDSDIIGITIFDLEGRIRDANDAFLRMVRYDREDLASGRLHRTNLTPPEWRDRDDRNLAQLKLTGSVPQFEKEYFRKDGSRLPVLIGAASFEDAENQGVAFVLDLTERKRAEEALRKSERSLRSAIDGIPGFVAILAPNGDVEAVNRQIVEYCGRSLEGLKNWSTSGTIHPDDRPHLEEVFTKSIATGVPYETEARLRRLDGEYRWFDHRGVPVWDESGRITRWYVLLTDIEDRTQALARLQQMQLDLAHINRVSMMGELAASLSHEIAQPIASARNNARAAQNFLKMKPPDLSEVREALSCIVGDADRAGEIINGIRAQIKKAPPRKERFDLNAAINEVLKLAQSVTNRNGVSVQTRLADGLLPIEGDRVQLQQVLLNLILNAAEAMSSVEEGARELLISTVQEQAGAVVAMRDSGPGIDPAHLDRVFHAFYTTKSSGTGMGLSICRSIIHAHGGELWAEANKPRGAVFRFRLPGAEAEPMNPPRAIQRT